MTIPVLHPQEPAIDYSGIDEYSTVTTDAVPDTQNSLDSWLSWLESVHPVSIDMGLERVARVADRLHLRPVSTPLILVAGTNGKGSTVAMLSSIYSKAGYRVGTYTSPHIDHFCERIRINGKMVGESDVIKALDDIEKARAPESLTYFEYTTLAAMSIFLNASCDVLVLEVGLGGRLDATNIWDADCAIVTSVALDHQEYLGSDISVIATEKAAVGRQDKPLIVGQPDAPRSLFEFAVNKGFEIVDIGALSLHQLPKTGMVGSHQRRNAGCAVAAVESLQERLPVGQDTIGCALMSSFVTARFDQTSAAGVEVIMDVAHNPAAAQALRRAWQDKMGESKCEIIFASLIDKDIEGLVCELSPIVAQWRCLQLDVARAMPVEQLADAIRLYSDDAQVTVHDDAEHAWRLASESARMSLRKVLVAGSFHTIAAVREVVRFEV